MISIIRNPFNVHLMLPRILWDKNIPGITNPIKCFHCGGPHLSRNYTTKIVTCSSCGKLGHYRNECKKLIKEKRNGGRNNGGKNQLGRPKTAVRVFTMNGTKVVQSKDLIQVKCIINGHLVNVQSIHLYHRTQTRKPNAADQNNG